MAERTVLHSDCNCFYASVEHLHHPELAGKPVAVGGDPEARHGIILTADYLAKRCGVKAGMTLWEARQLCPDITFFTPRIDLYMRFSNLAREIYGEFTDQQEAYGIDESWLDVTESVHLIGDGLAIAEAISNKMKKELGITVSIGVSFNKIYAKLASDLKKPDGITTMYKSEFREKGWRLPVGDLLYVGKSIEKKLYGLGVQTIGDLATTELPILENHLGKMGDILWTFANGYDDSRVDPDPTHVPIKSFGNSTTTPRDLVNDADVEILLYVLSESVAARLREHGFLCRTVEIWVRDTELVSFVRQRKLPHATDITGEIAAEAFSLFQKNYGWAKPIRSIGVRGADLVAGNCFDQLDLFCSAEQRERKRKADTAIDDIRRRFGYYSVQRGLMYNDRLLSSLNAKEEHNGYPRSYIG